MPRRYAYECRRPTLDRSSYLRTAVADKQRSGIPYASAVKAVARDSGMSVRVLHGVLQYVRPR